MAIEAPVSKFRKNNLIIYSVACILFAVWCGYEGFYSEKFIEKHTDEEGNPDSTLVFNRKSPPFFVGGAVLMSIYLLVIRERKIIADDNELVIDDKEKISLDSIRKIDKTNYEKKGIFVITYKDSEGKEINRKLSNRAYDNMTAVLDHLVAKIS